MGAATPLPTVDRTRGGADPRQQVLEWSPDGRLLAMFLADPLPQSGVEDRLDLVAPDGATARRVTLGPPIGRANELGARICWSPDSRWILARILPLANTGDAYIFGGERWFVVDVERARVRHAREIREGDGAEFPLGWLAPGI